jgi:hypothetical protein
MGADLEAHRDPADRDPARLRTVAGEPIAMAQVPDHQIRIVGVQAIGADFVGLDVLR